MTKKVTEKLKVKVHAPTFLKVQCFVNKQNFDTSKSSSKSKPYKLHLFCKLEVILILKARHLLHLETYSILFIYLV